MPKPSSYTILNHSGSYKLYPERPSN